LNLGQDIDNDLEVVNGQLVLVGSRQGSQTREIEEHIEQRLRTLRGEWFLDNTIGIPYFEEFYRKDFDAGFIESLLIQEILETPGVVRLLEFNMSLDKNTRTLNVTPLRIEAISGVIDFENLEVA